MKKQFIMALATCLTALFSFTSLFAQGQNAVAAKRPQSMQARTIAALIDAPTSPPASTGVFVNAKVMRSFLDLFNDATDVKWSQNKGQYYASFMRDDKVCKALFSSDGALIHSLQYGSEKDLPQAMRRLVKSNYVDYKINVVSELTTNDLKAWIVNLADSNNIIVACVWDGNLEELHTYKNAAAQK